MKVWAYIFADGRIVADSFFKDEQDTWDTILGWPDEPEILQASKDAGDRVELVEIVRAVSSACASPRQEPVK